jgi:hypothetical protein
MFNLQVIKHLGTGSDRRWRAYLYAIGYRHGETALRHEYLDLFVPYFVRSLHKICSPLNVMRAEMAWANFFQVVIYCLKDAIIL